MLCAVSLFFLGCDRPATGSVVVAGADSSVAVERPSAAEDEAAIKQVLSQETETFFAGDHAAWSTHLVQEPYLSWAVTPFDQPGAVFALQGWETINAFSTNSWFGEKNAALRASTEKGVNTRTDWNIQIRDDVAWVAFKQQHVNSNPPATYHSAEARVLERQDGKWRVALQSTAVDFANSTLPD